MVPFIGTDLYFAPNAKLDDGIIWLMIVKGFFFFFFIPFLYIKDLGILNLISSLLSSSRDQSTSDAATVGDRKWKSRRFSMANICTGHCLPSRTRANSVEAQILFEHRW